MRCKVNYHDRLCTPVGHLTDLDILEDQPGARMCEQVEWVNTLQLHASTSVACSMSATSPQRSAAILLQPTSYTLHRTADAREQRSQAFTMACCCWTLGRRISSDWRPPFACGAGCNGARMLSGAGSRFGTGVVDVMTLSLLALLSLRASGGVGEYVRMGNDGDGDSCARRSGGDLHA